MDHRTRSCHLGISSNFEEKLDVRAGDVAHLIVIALYAFEQRSVASQTLNSRNRAPHSRRAGCRRILGPASTRRERPLYAGLVVENLASAQSLRRK